MDRLHRCRAQRARIIGAAELPGHRRRGGRGAQGHRVPQPFVPRPAKDQPVSQGRGHGVARAGPAIVKPNLEELEILVGRRLSTPDGADRAAVAAAVARLRAAGAEAVVASLGPEGLLAVTSDGRWQARPPAVTAGNATGAGDAVAAALAHGLVLGRPWDERLRHAVALGAATAAAPVAGEFSRADYTSALAAATVQQVHPVHPVRGDEAR